MSSLKTRNVTSKLNFNSDYDKDLPTKTMLAIKLNSLIDHKGLSQTEAAQMIGMTQPKVSQVRRYKLQNISLERLMQALVSLDQDVIIVIKQSKRINSAGIKVAA